MIRKTLRNSGEKPADAIQKSRKRINRSIVLLCVTLCLSVAQGQVNVTTYHNDNFRTGQNTQEAMLTPGNVNTNQFGRLFSSPVDGDIYAQPLYVAGLNMPGSGVHNVVFAATEGDSVYAFDADNGTQLWQASMIDTAHGAAPGATTVDSNLDIQCGNITPQVGITSTPVIDLSSGTIFVEAKSKENGGFVHRLHALDITSGNEKFPGPAVIGGSSQGVTFDPLQHMNRPALLLMGGNIYIAFASHCDHTPYFGWVFAYDAGSFAQTGIFITTPNPNVPRPNGAIPGAGGIWMSGAGPAGDGVNVFASTGNGDFDNLTDFGDSIIRLTLGGGGLAITDWFTPANQDSLNAGDQDVGSGGVLLLPDQPGAHLHELVQAAKEGKIYVIDRDQMTTDNLHYCPNCASDQIVQELPNAIVGGIWNMPAYWNNNVYFWGQGDVLRAFSVSNGLLSFQGASGDTYGYPGATPSVSSNGVSSGIVWSLKVDAFGSHGPAVLRAHDAIGLNLLYSSDQNPGRDNPGPAVEFTVPTVANGKVYVGTSGQLSAFGLLGSATLGWHGPTFIASGVSSNPALIQSGYGTVGNFEVVVSSASGGLLHYFRNNDDPSLPWSGPTPFGQSLGIVNAVTMIESNFGSPGNLEVVARVGDSLYTFFRDSTTLAWNGPGFLTNGVAGNPSLIQSRYGTMGNFELVVPLASGGLAHYFRNNDDPTLPWSGPTPFGQSLGAVDAVSLIESNFGSPGNLEVVARTGDALYHFYRDSTTLAWSGPDFVASGATGTPSLIQGRFGTVGNFELVTPSSGGGLVHYFRNNDDPALPWSGPTFFGQSIGAADGASLIESNFGNPPGNLEVAVQAGGALFHFFRD